MNKKTTGIVAYITLIGWIIAYLAGDKEGAKFHLNQALVILIANLCATIISKIPVIGILGTILGVVVLVLWILGIVAAIKEEEKPVPVIGEIKILK